MLKTIFCEINSTFVLSMWVKNSIWDGMRDEKWWEFSISACPSILHLWFVFNGGTTNGKFINDFPIPDAIPYH